MNFGATQGAETAAFRKTERFKLETIAMPPELAAVRIPGIGDELMRKLGELPEPRGVGPARSAPRPRAS